VEAQEAAERPKPSRRTLVLLVAPIVVITSLGFVATAFTPALAARHPLLLIALDARNRFLVLARGVDLVPFVVVAVLRRSLSDPLFYLLGRFYGEGALRWLERKGGGGQLVVITEKFFHRAGYPMVFLFPGAIVCALAGQTGMAPAGFVIANVAVGAGRAGVQRRHRQPGQRPPRLLQPEPGGHDVGHRRPGGALVGAEPGPGQARLRAGGARWRGGCGGRIRCPEGRRGRR